MWNVFLLRVDIVHIMGLITWSHVAFAFHKLFFTPVKELCKSFSGVGNDVLRKTESLGGPSAPAANSHTGYRGLSGRRIIVG